jgi:hypothetical protein
VPLRAVRPFGRRRSRPFFENPVDLRRRLEASPRPFSIFKVF